MLVISDLECRKEFFLACHIAEQMDDPGQNELGKKENGGLPDR